MHVGVRENSICGEIMNTHYGSSWNALGSLQSMSRRFRQEWNMEEIAHWSREFRVLFLPTGQRRWETAFSLVWLRVSVVCTFRTSKGCVYSLNICNTFSLWVLKCNPTFPTYTFILLSTTILFSKTVKWVLSLTCCASENHCRRPEEATGTLQKGKHYDSIDQFSSLSSFCRHCTIKTEV